MDKWEKYAEKILLKEKNQTPEEYLDQFKWADQYNPDIIEKERQSMLERKKHSGNHKRSYNKGRTKYQIVEGSKRQSVFKLLYKHPSMTIECLYKLFDSSTKMNRQVLKNYKSTFIKKFKINNSNSKPFHYENYESEQIQRLNEINSIYDKFSK